MKLKHLVVAVSLSLGLTACGGDGDSTNAASYDFTVTAIDGYLANAIVTATCGNQTFTGVTNASGVAQIDTNGIASSNCAIAITANPDGSTTDIDTGDKYAANSLYLLSHFLNVGRDIPHRLQVRPASCVFSNNETHCKRF